jgi:hypothetical protein
MTMRESIKRRFWKLVLTLVVAVSAYDLLTRHLPNFSLNSNWTLIAMTAFLGVFVCAVWAFYQWTALVCPSCRVWLVYTSIAIGCGKRVHGCSKCGVNFDEAMPR